MIIRSPCEPGAILRAMRVNTMIAAKYSTVNVTATSGSPAPQASPTAALTHTDAAVVKPETMLPRTKMTPAPKKPIPETIPAAKIEEHTSELQPRRHLECR